MDAFVNVDGVFSSHHLTDGRVALLLLAILLCGRHSARPKLERLCFPFLQSQDPPVKLICQLPLQLGMAR